MTYNSVMGKLMVLVTDTDIMRKVFSVNDPARLLMAVHPSAKNILGPANLAFMHGPAHKVRKRAVPLRPIGPHHALIPFPQLTLCKATLKAHLSTVCISVRRPAGPDLQEMTYSPQHDSTIKLLTFRAHLTTLNRSKDLSTCSSSKISSNL